MARIKSGFPGERSITLPQSVLIDFVQSELGSKLHITDIGFYPKARHHFRSRTTHEAAQYIFIYCVNGEGWIKIEDQTHLIKASQAIVIPQGKPHQYRSDTRNPWTIYWIHFNGTMASFFGIGMEKPIEITTNNESRINDRIELFEAIFSSLTLGFSKQNLEYSVTVLFHFLGTLKFLSAFRISNYKRQSNPDPMEAAIHYMKENLQKTLQVNELAHYTGLSTSHFSALFKQKTGFAPLSYFNMLRIQSACHQLDYSQLQIHQIAMMTGFNDPLYFSRLFTKIMGICPTAYRKREKG